LDERGRALGVELLEEAIARAALGDDGVVRGDKLLHTPRAQRPSSGAFVASPSGQAAGAQSP
jgi:hypothetical protein